MQRNRRRDPHPVTWEVPAGIITAVVVLAVLCLHIGRGIANLLAGGWWGFPDRAHLFTALPKLVAGDAAAGLQRVEGPVAARPILWTGVVVVEIVLLLLITMVLKVGLERWGPGRLHGVATKAEAERILGRSRLRRHAAIVRPDLYGKDRGRS